MKTISRPPQPDTDALVSHQDPYKWPAITCSAFLVLTLPVVLGIIILLQPNRDPNQASSGRLTVDTQTTPNGVSFDLVRLGQKTYSSSCVVCHGPGAEGVKGLGKPLKNSAFVQSASDNELFNLLVDGRPISDPLNTTGALMPPRGAQELADSELRAVVSYLRSIQNKDAEHASMAAWEPSNDAKAGTLVGAIELTKHPGYDLFVASCAACHGQGAEGMEGLGLPLTTSGFVRGKIDKDLITFIKTGRASWDENNTTGIDMPPKGGNPAITDEQLQTIVDYIRAVQNEAMGS